MVLQNYNYLLTFLFLHIYPGAPLTYFNDGGGGGCLSDFFGSEILAKSNTLGSVKDPGIFLGCEKMTEGLFGYAKKVVIF